MKMKIYLRNINDKESLAYKKNIIPLKKYEKGAKLDSH